MKVANNNKSYKLSADYQACYGCRPEVVEIVDSNRIDGILVAPVTMTDSGVSLDYRRSFWVQSDDLVEV